MDTTFGSEARNFLRACKALHELLAREPLGHDDRDLITELITKLKSPSSRLIIPTGGQ